MKRWTIFLLQISILLFMNSCVTNPHRGAQTAYIGGYPKEINGKYCEDLGFGWECVDFKANGKCKITAGHSYWTNKFRGKWTNKADTIVVIQFAGKTSPADTSYYYFKSDSLYSISYQDKIAIRGKALVKQD